MNGETAISQNDSLTRIKGYRFSFIIGGIILLTGLVLDLSKILVPQIPPFPNNLYLGLVFVNFLLVGYFYFRTSSFIKWLMSIPASISAIFYYTLLILIMGFVPQESTATGWAVKIGFNDILSGWTFQIIQIFFITTLGMVTLKRTIPFKLENWGFILNHLGLWIIIFAVAMGSGDFKRWTMPIYEGQTSMTAFDKNGMVHNLPFAIELIDFDIEEYPEKIVLVEKSSGKIVGSSFVPTSETGKKIELGSWHITIRQLSNPEDISKGGTTNKFHIQAHNGTSSVEDVLFIQQRNPAFLLLNEDVALALLPADPKKYVSKININNGQRTIPADVLVNQPASFDGWKIYQVSYDEKAGKDSTYSVLEVITDPWLPVVYTGLFMMIIGAFYLMWMGNKLTTKENGLE